MALRQMIWKSLYLNLAASVIMCASLGCKNTRGETGPNLNAPLKTAMGPGNQVQISPTSPAYKNVTAGSQGGQSSMQNSSLLNQGNSSAALQGAQLQQNQSGMLNQGNANSSMQGMQLPQMNREVNPSPSLNLNQPNPVVIPNDYRTPSNPPVDSVPMLNLNQPNQLPSSLQQNQGPSLMPLQGQPTSLNEDLRIPDVPVNVREAASVTDPSLKHASHTQSNLTLDPGLKELKEPALKEIAEMRGGRRTQQSAPVVITPVEPQPVLQAPITPLPPIR